MRGCQAASLDPISQTLMAAQPQPKGDKRKCLQTFIIKCPQRPGPALDNTLWTKLQHRQSLPRKGGGRTEAKVAPSHPSSFLPLWPQGHKAQRDGWTDRKAQAGHALSEIFPGPCRRAGRSSPKEQPGGGKADGRLKASPESFPSRPECQGQTQTMALGTWWH
ncbi:uncharacterized protein LOC115898289 isoform X2 [Rhinopithecus roxellana]|uniref:uncharacterized protein LOC115898289 isoform X2 n=1 Tax=Rhinopithecus roxellana TaxID=61622 RepID=UPI0012370E67|nr:uncharacterized protein LOC115898289 isoform X2 [Rhinopithecus roxellana]